MKRKARAYIGGILIEGMLTTEHSASSYGLPVFVANGTAYASAEIDEADPEIRFPDRSEPSMIQEAEAAGFKLAFDY